MTKKIPNYEKQNFFLVIKVVRHEGSFTIFAPSNEAFDHPDNYPGTFKLADRVRFHIGRGLVKQSSIRDEDQIMTLLNKRKIRFNVYQGRDQNGDMVKIKPKINK